MKMLKVRTDLCAGMTNPASTYCVQQGGESIIVRDNDGNEYGLCKLPGNKYVEEWSFFNHQCK